ncbi:tail fiber protein [Achromobacter phage Motura]|uniref:Tail fiber protein n=1 Tax=Achromobacter phage Motura TaxID=2591403 RepID=A0A514CT46_9CAUD|nr:tail fiber protein [Achromobacter phage Motura]QDH83636.1 tail fiber protein [Achromobacter phage Motura]
MATKYLLYRSATASAKPTAVNMPEGKLAVNTADERLYFKNNSGTIVEPAPRAHTHPWSQVTNREATALTTQNLNDITTPGSYYMNSNAGATAELNYPVLFAGLLTVETAVSGNVQCTQTYTTNPTTNPRTFVRIRFGSGLAWGSWFELARVDQAMTHTFLTAATDANTMIADNTFYTWTASAAVGANFPTFTTAWPAAGYMRVYYAAATQVTQELTFIVTGQKSRTFTRFGNTSTNAWQPWKSTSDWSAPTGLPSSDMGDIYVDGQGVYRWNGSAYALVQQDAVPLGAVLWWPQRSSVPAGYLPADGQTVTRATYPDLTLMVTGAKVPVATEAAWSADVTQRASYTPGNGTTTIRLPDYNGKSAGALGRTFLSGDGANASTLNGTIQQDAMQQITGSIASFFRAGNVAGTGALRATAYGSTPAQTGTGGLDNATITFDSALSARTATTTYPTNSNGVWVIKAFGAVVNPGSADAAQLASDYATLNAAVQSLYSAGILNLSAGGRIKTPSSGGAWTASGLVFQTNAGPTYVNAVPGTSGEVAGFIARHADSVNNAYVSLVQTPGGDAQLNFSAQGTAAKGNLVFTSATGQAGAIFQSTNTWMFGNYVAPSVNSRTVVNYTGSNNMFGTQYRPAQDNTTAILMQNAAGATVGSIGTSATATTFNTSSDRRLKRDITPIDPMQALESIMHLIPCNWIWRTTGTIGEGFIADEYQKELPDYVQGEPDGEGFQQLDKTGAIARMVGAIQALNMKCGAQQDLIDSQAQLITTLSEAIAALETRVSTLESANG